MRRGKKKKKKTHGPLLCFSDIDECANPAVCINGICENVDGSYLCTCNNGYTSNAQGICVGKYTKLPFVDGWNGRHLKNK